MIIKQISVFLNNEAGRTNDVTKLLAKNGINILAFSIADSSDFGMLRMIVSEEQKAVEVLKANHFAVIQTDVISINCPNTTGSLSRILEQLSENKVNVEYMYAFQQEGNSNAIIRPKEMDKALEALKNLA